MEAILIVAAVAIGAIIYFDRVIKKRTTVVVDDNSFAQNGVRVDFSAQTITIGKYSYPAKAVTGIRMNTVENRKGTIVAKTGFVDIEVDDFKKPVHKIVFNSYSVEKDTKEFAQRLSVALRKAGGTSFV